MEIVHGSALLVKTKDPNKITEVIRKSKVVHEQDGVYDTLVHWSLANAHLLKNLGFNKVLSPILEQYSWPGAYKPFAHQKDTASFLTLNRRAFCLNAMGTGKTSAAAWAADYLLEQGAVKRVLIICPLSIMDCAWRKDLFNTVMHRRVDIAHGTATQRAKVIRGDAEFVIINYDGIESVRYEIMRGGFDLVICDESTALKNAKTRRWKMVNSLITSDTWLWLMTGTPAAQSPFDAYGQAKLVNPKSVPAYATAFKDQIMIKVGTFQWVPKHDAMEVVHKIMQPAIRYTTEECLDLPEQLYTTYELDMSDQQKKYYEILRKEGVIQAVGEDVTAVNAAVQMGKLLQISSGAVYSDTGEVLEFDCKEKLNAMLDVVQQASHKTLIFCAFRHSIDLVEKFLNENGIQTGVIHGGVSAGKRTKIFNNFQEAKEPGVLIIQPQAAAHGVTLTAANVVIWFSPTTSAETYLQANARVHRAGQKNPCLVVHLCSSPVEKKLYKALETRTLAQNALLEMYKEFLVFGGNK
jgi:SNF2 family DNA or RNA helicase